MKPYSIENRIALATILGTAFVLLLTGLLLRSVLLNWIANEYDRNLLTKAQVLITLVEDLDGAIEFHFADEFMPEFDVAESPEYFQLWLQNGDVFERSHSLGGHDLPRHDENEIGYSFQNLTLRDGRLGRSVQIIFSPQIEEDNVTTPEPIVKQDTMILIVAKERNSLISLTSTVNYSMLVGFALILFILIGQIKYTVRKGLTPLKSVQHQFGQLSINNLNTKVSLENPPIELAAIIDQFNQLLERLNVSFIREKRFSSDVAHELRTPISELRNMAEVAIKWPDNPAATSGLYKEVLAISQQMQSTINNIFSLARCEKGAIILNNTKFNLADHIESAWLRQKQLAAQKMLTFVRQFQSNTKVLCSPDELDIILNNLISNAVAYSPDRSQITACISSSENGLMTIEIINIAEQLTLEDLPLMFDRLWRKDRARTASDHSGLGLSLVEAYANILGLNIVTSLSEQGAFSIRLEGFKVA